MDALFDNISRIVATSMPRRQALKAILGTGAGGIMAFLWPHRAEAGAGVAPVAGGRRTIPANLDSCVLGQVNCGPAPDGIRRQCCPPGAGCCLRGCCPAPATKCCVSPNAIVCCQGDCCGPGKCCPVTAPECCRGVICCPIGCPCNPITVTCCPPPAPGQGKGAFNLSGGGTFLASTQTKSLARIAICGLGTCNPNSCSNASDLAAGLSAYDFATRTQIDLVSLSSFTGSLLGGGDLVAMGEGMATVNGVLRGIEFEATKMNSVITFEIVDATTQGVLVDGTDEPGRAALELTISP